MLYRRFRPLSVDVSVIGFGTWAMGGEATLGGKALGWGPTDRGEAERAVAAAIEGGVTFFDTADVYGNGTAEALLGEWLPPKRDLVVCTKFGNREDAGGKGVQDFGPEWLRASVEGSLRRLRRERLDVLLLHSPPDDFDWSRFDAAPLTALVEAGKVGCYGVSCRSIKGAERVLAARFGSVLEIIYNAVDRRATRMLPQAEAAGYAVIARVPLASGFLSGRCPSTPGAFPRTDYRSALPAEEVAWRAAAAGKLAFLADEPGGMAVSALRFCVSRPEIATVIPGMRTRAQVAENLLASVHGPLGPDALRRIEQAVPRTYPGWET